MRKIILLFAVMCLLGTALPGVAQDEGEEPGDVVRAYTTTVKDSDILKYEQAYKGHAAWHAKQKDDWRWDVWQQLSGPNLGTYVVLTVGHEFSDFDERGEFDAADGKHYLETVAQYTEGSSASMRVVRGDLSRWSFEGQPAMATVFEFYLRTGKAEQFVDALREIKKAADKTEWALSYGIQQFINGSRTPKFLVVLPAANWAGLAPPDVSFQEMLAEGLGKAAADGVNQKFNESVDTQITTLWAYRSDLSYVPDGK